MRRVPAASSCVSTSRKSRPWTRPCSAAFAASSATTCEDPTTREVAFRLTAGPLREFAELARREGNRHIPHFLVIDEINRANLAKVFGELYFLLEYRDRSVRLTYSDEDFSLPRNLSSSAP